MITTKQWKKSIFEIIGYIADKESQQRGWLGNETEFMILPEDMYCELIEGLSFSDFIKDPDVALTDKQKELGIKLEEMMTKYSKLDDGNFDLGSVILSV